MTLEEFKTELQRHDWFYMMSDDTRVYYKGLGNLNKLKGIAEKGGEVYKDLFNEIEGFHFKDELPDYQQYFR